MFRSIFCVFIATFWLLVCFPLACLFMLVRLDASASLWVARHLWAPVMLWAGGARLTVHGLEHVDAQRPTIYVANHQSTIDIPTLFMALPVDLRFVAKTQLRWVPMIGWYLWLAGHIFVDRHRHREAIHSLDAAAEKIRSGTSIILFPEGTRSPDGTVLPFKKGPFALALKSRVPICPITIEGSGRLMPKNSWKITPGPIHVMIGAPIDTTAFAEQQREELIRVARDRIIEQSLMLGGMGGDRVKAVAARGLEGVSRQGLEKGAA